MGKGMAWHGKDKETAGKGMGTAWQGGGTRLNGGTGGETQLMVLRDCLIPVFGRRLDYVLFPKEGTILGEVVFLPNF